jgi:hypothetical protein
LRPDRPTYTLLLGDFNRHHPIWDDPTNAHLFTHANLEKAQKLIDLTADFNLTMTLPPKIPTLQALSSGRYMRVDNVFISDDIAHLVTKCTTNPKLRPIKTDHLPIITALECTVPQTVEAKIFNIKKADWEQVRATLKEQLPEWEDPAMPTTIEELEEMRMRVTNAITTAMENGIPFRNPSKWMKRWWVKELGKQRKIVRRLSRKTYKKRCDPDHECHEQFRRERNRLTRMIEKAKTKMWDQFRAEMDASTIWAGHQMANGNAAAGATRTPPIQMTDIRGRIRMAEIDEEKAKVLEDAFFPKLDMRRAIPRSSESDYPPPKFQRRRIT